MAGKAPPDRFEQEGDAFFERVRRAYQNRASQSSGRINTIDSSRSMDNIRKELEVLIANI